MSIAAFFDAPTRVVVRSGVGAVPIGTVIGSDLPPDLVQNEYIWHSGWTNTYDLTQAYGNRQETVIMPFTTGWQPPVLLVISNGIVVTVTWTEVSDDILADTEYPRFTIPQSVASQMFFRVRRVKQATSSVCS